MARTKARVKVPKTAKPGEIVTIKTLLTHPMESGHRIDLDTRQRRPRKIINEFSARFNGEEVIRLAMEPSIAANPFFEFDLRVDETGVIDFEWIDDDGTITKAEKTITVKGG